ncbi:MAG: sugar phosphorylase [Anaerolineaceae bacterium]|nr:sugar phosphorylase [Anaerolineaceae bacterium]
MTPTLHESILTKLTLLYGADAAPELLKRVLALVAEPAPMPDTLAISERDVILITYGDQVHREDEAPLATLHAFLKVRLAGAINAVHILPFYPYTSDDGFSVIDYRAVNPAFGDWDDVSRLNADFRLMFDAVINHISSQSAWFQAFLRDEAPYADYFITVDPAADLSQVVRPRTLPLLTPVMTPSGEKHVWTTFSDDQIDLNYANPDVLLDVLRTLLFYVHQGADFIRLDAIAFMWKEIGTSCIHLPQTHAIIQLMRDVLNLAAPSTVLITETNVPHEENISYFGNGRDEAQMVYQFPLPPLTLHTLRTGDARALTRWAANLKPVGDQTTFFNFTASHDGIGLRPVTGLLAPEDVDALIQLTQDHGGRVSYRSLPDGSKSAYELNISYFDAITHPGITVQQPVTAASRFLVSQAIPLALAGVPGIYFHSLFGSRNDLAGMAATKRERSINRQKLHYDALNAELDAADSIRHQVYTRYMHLLRIRTAEPAFHPLGGQTVLDLHPAVFAVERVAPDGGSRVVALHNVSGKSVTVTPPGGQRWHDLVTDTVTDAPEITLRPYRVAWVKAV